MEKYNSVFTTLFLVRHGETEGSDISRYKGSIDVPLSGKGSQQIKRTSAHIKEYINSRVPSKYLDYLRNIQDPATAPPETSARKQLTAVYCSDLGRSVMSAGIIAEQYGLQPVEIPDFRERHFGIWEGMSFAEIREKYSAEFEAWAANPLKFSPVKGESTTEVRDRVIPSLNRILDRHKGENIAIVGHGGINRIILCHFLGIPLENIFRIEQEYAAVNIIEFWEKYPVLKLLNG